MTAVKTGRYIGPAEKPYSKPIKLDRPTQLTAARFGQF